MTPNQKGSITMTRQISHYIEEDRGPGRPPKRIPVVECCGHNLACYDSWANSCPKCGTEFNGSGQRLNPRHMWGEETGETFY